jgi:hypothetical protein
MSLPMLTVAGTSTPARAVAAQLATSNTNACTAGPPPGTTGCAHAAATRALGQVEVGTLTAGGVGPVGMDHGLVRLTGLTETVLAEEGEGARPPQYTRTGHLSVWLASNTYAEVDLNPTTSASYPIDAQVVYTAPSGKTITLHYTGQVTVSAAQLVRTPATRTGNLATDCKDEACVSQYNGGSPVVIALTVSVVDGTTGAESGKFGIAADLGGLIGQATYKEAADA